MPDADVRWAHMQTWHVPSRVHATGLIWIRNTNAQWATAGKHIGLTYEMQTPTSDRYFYEDITRGAFVNF